MTEPKPQHDLDKIEQIRQEMNRAIAQSFAEDVDKLILGAYTNGQNDSSTEDR